MTKEQITKLEELERSEPPAPWRVSPLLFGDARAYECVERHTLYRADDAVEFLVAARNALPRLLEDRERMLTGLRDAKKALRFIHGHNTCAEGAVDDVIAHVTREVPL